MMFGTWRNMRRGGLYDRERRGPIAGMSQPPYGTIPYYTPAFPQNPRPTSLTVMAIVGIIVGVLGVVCSPLALVPYFVQIGPPNPVLDAIKNDRLIFNWMIGSVIAHWPIAVLLLASSI